MRCRTTRLSASRILRARKICAFIFDKLELGPTRGRAGSVISINSPITNTGTRRPSTQPQVGGAPQSNQPGNAVEIIPEEVIELVCGDTVVDPKITLATLKQYYGAGGDMLLHYRLKKDVTLA